MDVTVLKNVSIFSQLPQGRLAKLLEKLRRRTVKKNTLLFQTGDPGTELFILDEGKIRIFLSHPDGREMTLTVLEPYEYFGELTLLDGLSRSASAITLETSTLFSLSKEAFHEFLAENPAAIYGLLKASSLLIRRLTDQVQSLSFHDVRARVARKILEMAQKGSRKGNGVEIPFSVTHQDLANMVGSARESVTRAINFFEEKGMLKMDRKSILLVSPGDLEKFA